MKDFLGIAFPSSPLLIPKHVMVGVLMAGKSCACSEMLMRRFLNTPMAEGSSRVTSPLPEKMCVVGGEGFRVV